MNLRQVGTIAGSEFEPDAAGPARSSSSVSRFVAPANLIGNIGEPLDYGGGQDAPEDDSDIASLNFPEQSGGASGDDISEIPDSEASISPVC